VASHNENSSGDGGGQGPNRQSVKSPALPASLADYDESRERGSVEEIVNYCRKSGVSNNLLDLRDLALITNLSVQPVIERKKIQGIQYILDYPITGTRLGESVLTPEGRV